MPSLTDPTLFTSRPKKLQAKYTTTVTASTTATVGYFELGPNSALNIACTVDQNATIVVTDFDPEDGKTFGSTSYTVTSAAPAAIYHRGSAGGARVQITASGSDVIPDLRVYGMSQP